MGAAATGAAPAPAPPPRLADRYDVVTDFGASGDGVADDTKPLQASFFGVLDHFWRGLNIWLAHGR
jgi:hypothetical protein